MRIASPHAAIDIPTSSDRPVGCARMSTSTPNTNPSATRSRASTAISVDATPSAIGSCLAGADDARTGRQTPLDGAEHLGDFDVEEAHPIQPAAAQVMTLA